MEKYTFVLTIASIIVPVLATILASVYTVVNRVKAEHKPYLVLDTIEDLNHLDKCLYFVIMLGNKLRRKYHDRELDDIVNKGETIDVKIRLRNIGYGVATNIRFYDLNTGNKIYGTQEVDDKINQRLFTTFDIASGDHKSVQTSLVIKKVDNKVLEDSVHILCIYQDLNNNVYNFLFVINIKSGGGYDYYAYQPSSHSYQQLVKQYRHQTKKITKDYWK